MKNFKDTLLQELEKRIIMRLPNYRTYNNF